MLARCLEGEGEPQPNPGGKWVRQLASPQSCFRCISCPLAIKLTYDFKKLAMRAVAVRDHVQIQLRALPYLWSNFNPGAPSLEGCISWSSDPPSTQNRARTRLLCILWPVLLPAQISPCEPCAAECEPDAPEREPCTTECQPCPVNASPVQQNASSVQRNASPVQRGASGVQRKANPGQRNARLMQLWAAECEPCSAECEP